APEDAVQRVMDRRALRQEQLPLRIAITRRRSSSEGEVELAGWGCLHVVVLVGGSISAVTTIVGSDPDPGEHADMKRESGTLVEGAATLRTRERGSRAGEIDRTHRTYVGRPEPVAPPRPHADQERHRRLAACGHHLLAIDHGSTCAEREVWLDVEPSGRHSP